MGNLFQTLLTMSIYGTAAACVVSLLLTLLRRTRCAKTPLLLLWAVVAFRLICPWSPPSPLSLFNYTRQVEEITVSVTQPAETIQAAGSAAEADPPAVSPAVPTLPDTEEHPLPDVNGEIAQTAPVPDPLSAMDTAAIVWLIGLGILLLYTVLSHLLLLRRLRFSVKDSTLPGVWYSDRIVSPCVVGFFPPRIYLTFGMSTEEREYVLAHERQHIRTGDHLWKVVGWLVLCVHWFNPLLWLVYRFFLLTIEDACDQRVLGQLGEERRADYGQALLSLSTRRLISGPSPIAFDEGNTKKRVKNILCYKNSILWVTAIAVIIAIAIGVGIFTSPEEALDAPPEGGYNLSSVVAQTLLSSSTNEYFFEVSKTSHITISPQRFSIEGSGFIDTVSIPSPVYEPMEDLNGIIPNWVKEDGSFELSMGIPVPEGTQGYHILTQDGEDSGYHVFVLEDGVWLGRWLIHGTTASIGEYWYIVSIVPGAPLPSTPAEDEAGWLDDAVIYPIPTEAPEGTVSNDPEMELPGSDWEDLVLTWTFPKSSEDLVADSFPLLLGFSKNYFTASCAGGTPYAYHSGDLISAHPIVNANSSVLYWWPYEEGSDQPAETASITLTAHRNGEAILSCSLLFHLTGETRDTITYSIQATLHGNEEYLWLENPYTCGGMIRDADSGRPETVATFTADLTHDGVDEQINVLSDFDGDLFYVQVRNSSGRELWSDAAGVPHVGQNGIYLYEEDGAHYLMNWCNYGISGFASINYTVFSLTESGDPVIRYKNHFDMALDSPLALDMGTYQIVNEESIRLLSNSIVLASTNGDTPSREYYSTPDHILTPILQEDYLMWWTPEELAAIQAKAQGTYTFLGEVVNVFEDSLLVEDQSLWAPDGYLYYFSIPVEDPGQFFIGDKVQVTADGPIYRSVLPDDGTTVEVVRLDALPS